MPVSKHRKKSQTARQFRKKRNIRRNTLHPIESIDPTFYGRSGKPRKIRWGSPSSSQKLKGIKPDQQFQVNQTYE